MIILPCYVLYLFARHCLAIWRGSAVASKAFSTRVLKANRLSISVVKAFNLSSSSCFQYLMSSSLCSAIVKLFIIQLKINKRTYINYLLELLLIQNQTHDLIIKVIKKLTGVQEFE